MEALLVLYLGWLAFVVWRLFTEQLPRPSDIVFLSVAFYNVPLSLLAVASTADLFGDFRIFLNPAAEDATIAKHTLLAVVVASLSVMAGAALGRVVRRSSSHKIVLPLNRQFQLVSSATALFCLAVIGFGIALFGIGSFFEGYAVESLSETATAGTALVFFSYEVIGLCSFFWLASRLATGHSVHLIGIVAALLCIVILTALRGKRLEMIIALMPVFLLVWSSILRRPSLRALTLAISVAVIASMASLRYGAVPTPLSLAFDSVSEGLYAGHVTPGVIEAINQGDARYEYGLRLLAAIAAFVPRFVFPSKDELIYSSLTDISSFAPLGATSLLGEIYLQGGLLAVAVGFLAIGIVAGWVQVKQLMGQHRTIDARVLPYVLFMCSFVPHFRDGLMPAIKIPLQLGLVAIVLVALAQIEPRRVRRRRAREQSGPAVHGDEHTKLSAPWRPVDVASGAVRP